jgi:transposase
MPIEVSSDYVIRHRLSRAGNRQLNCCLHVMAMRMRSITT